MPAGKTTTAPAWTTARGRARRPRSDGRGTSGAGPGGAGLGGGAPGDGDGSGRPAWPARGSLVSPAERAQLGKSARAEVAREAHAALDLPAGRDPVGLLEQQSRGRLPDLVPVRYGRMSASPFAYFRGAALPMAADLAATPVTGLTVQCCGDAHLSNFGAFGSPERRLVFDVNDFDETLPGPWEWDVKRLAASVEIAGRDNSIPAGARRAIVLATLARYQEAMRGFAGQTSLQVWYASLDAAELEARLKPAGKQRRSVDADLARARSSDSMAELAKLTTRVNGHRQIISDPPLVVPVRDLAAGQEDAGEELGAMLHDLLASYRSSLSPDRAQLLGRYELAGIARKVVGVGSVGTRCWVVLMLGPDGNDPLFLQVKEAAQSVLASFTGRDWPGNQGERVVLGQRYMQAASDILLGWVHVPHWLDGGAHDYYVRQLRDWKLSFSVEGMAPGWLQQYAAYCGWTLARAHAKTGDRFGIAAYLGSADAFGQAVADFAAAYADQNEKDHAALLAAIRSGRLQAQTGV